MTEQEEVRESTSIRIKPSVWKEAKHAAVDEGIDVSELNERALQAYIRTLAKRKV